MRLVTVLLFVFAAAGCVSNTMKSFIGQPVQSAYIEWGAPDSEFDLPDGRRAFQWRNDRLVAGQLGSMGTSSTPVIVRNNQCFYTLIAAWDESAEAWIVVDYEKPKLRCE